jgi:hypothetical protein
MEIEAKTSIPLLAESTLRVHEIYWQDCMFVLRTLYNNTFDRLNVLLTVHHSVSV